MKIGNVRDMIKSVRDVNFMDAKCFAQHLDYMELVIEFMKQMAAGTADVKTLARPPPSELQ